MQNARSVLRTRPIQAAQPRAWEEADEGLEDAPLTLSAGRRTSLRALMEGAEADGVLLIRRGKIVFERYGRGTLPSTKHALFSATRSWVGALAGCLEQMGALDLSAPVGDLVPALAASGFGGATTRDLLDMRSGVNSSVLQELMSGGFMARPPDAPDGMRAFVLSQRATGAHGGPFRYRTADTAALGWICEAVGGAPLDALIAQHLWTPMGAEQEADFVMDERATPVYTSGLCATLRDAGRFAQAMQGGPGSPLPPAWLQDTRRGTASAHAAFEAGGGTFFGHPVANGMYRNQHWVLDTNRGVTLAYGAYGQLLYSDPQAELCAVVLSRWKTPVSPWAQSWLRAFASLASDGQQKA